MKKIVKNNQKLDKKLIEIAVKCGTLVKNHQNNVKKQTRIDLNREKKFF